jgi:hypothetical protein
VRIRNSYGWSHIVVDAMGWVADGEPRGDLPEPSPGESVGFSAASSEESGFAAAQDAFWSHHDPSDALDASVPMPIEGRLGDVLDQVAHPATQPGAAAGDGDVEPLPVGWGGHLTGARVDPRVGRLVFWVPTAGQWNNCTATMVARNLALTAAHCVVDRNGNRYDRLAFFAGLEGTVAHGGVHTAVDTVYPTLDGRPAYADTDIWWGADYALVRFDATDGAFPGDRTGWYEVMTSPRRLTWLRSVGYPSEGSFFSPHCDRPADVVSRCWAWAEWGRRGELHQYPSGWLEMSWGSDMSGGSSGGPVFHRVDGVPFVVSINSNGWWESCDWFRPDGRCGSRRHVLNMWGPVFGAHLDRMIAAHREPAASPTP